MNPSLDKQSDPERYAEPCTSAGNPESVRIGTIDDQIFSMAEIDPVLDAKMRLVNQVRRPTTLTCV